MATKLEKLAPSIFTAIILLVGVGLELSGSFIPVWTSPRNNTGEDVSFSLWTRVQCWDEVCITTRKNIAWQKYTCDKRRCIKTSGYKIRPETVCRTVDYCNKTWHLENFDSVPSLLLVSKSFVTPGIVGGVIALMLYIIKIILMVKRPGKRLHLKASYLTFAAIGGAAAGVGVIIFCAMLDKDVYVLGWGPALPGVGGFLQLCVAFGGYLSWRDKYGDDFDDISLSSDRPMAIEKPTHKKRAYIEWDRSLSNTSGMSGAATPLPATSNV